MPLPPSVDTKTVEINATDLGGGTTIGRVVFSIRQALAVPIDNEVIFPEDVEAILTSGSATVELPPTNDPSVSPTDFVIYATAYTQQGGTHEFKFQIPHDATEPVQFADLINTTVSAPNASLLTVAQALAFITAAVASEPVTEDAVLAVLATATILASQISGELDDTNIPNLPASKITSGTFAAARIPDLSAVYQALTGKDAANGYAGLDASTKLLAAQIPDLSATYQALTGKNAASGYAGLDGSSKLNASQLPNHSGDLITSGTVLAARIDAAIARLTQVLQLNTSSQTVVGAVVFSALATFNAGLTATTVASEAWTALSGTYQGNYSAYSSTTYYTPKYRREQGTTGDVVHLRGRILNSVDAAFDDNIITGIPAAIRPGRNILVAHAVDNSNGGALEITSGGTIINKSGNATGVLSLDGIRYALGSN